jgi:hypothetical protein
MKSALETWTEADKRIRDRLDRRVAALHVVDEKGNVKPRDHLTDAEAELIDKWQARENNPSFIRMRRVRERIEQRKQNEGRWWRTEKTALQIAIAAGVAIIAWEEPQSLTLTNVLIVGVLYSVWAVRIEIVQLLEKKEEDQILREWDIAQEINFIRNDIFEIKKQQREAVSLRKESIDRLSFAIREAIRERRP